jgi:long-chain acyl-CoA synthetase
MISGSAAAPLWLLEFFDSIGLPILEAYGVSENPLPVAANRPGAYRFGSVGKPLPPNEVRIGPEGEVLVKGPVMFVGYDGETARERFTADHFYRTGDVGYFDADGYLYLTGRASEIIKTSGGRRISPTAIEGVYRQSRYIDQIVVIGNERPYLAALICVNRDAVAAALSAANLAVDAIDRTSSDVPTAFRLIEQELATLGSALSRAEQIRAFAILPEPFRVDTGELTTTLKPRRRQIERRHRETIDELYAPAPVESAAP